MTKRLTYNQLMSALSEAGLQKGDCAIVQSSLIPVGPVEVGTDRQAILDFYFNGILEVLGDKGTLLAFTAFPDYGRFGIPFVLEESPSRMGVLSEHIRKQKGSVRSIHPIANVTGLGPEAEEFCGGFHYEGFGYDSPWGRMHRGNVKIINIGLWAFTMIHYIEASYGVPYQYIKIYDTPVYANGCEIDGPFTMTCRYLDFSIWYDYTKIMNRLLDVGLTAKVKLGGSYIYATNSLCAFDEGISALNENRYFFLKERPHFRTGEYPMDGITGDLQEVYEGPRQTSVKSKS